MIVFLYFLIGALIFGLFMKFSIEGIKKMAKFLMIYEFPDVPKHSKKSMRLSLVPLVIFLFVLAVGSSFGAFVLFVMVPAWFFFFYFYSHYIKLWKYHGYSVALLIFGSLFWLACSFALSGPVREGLRFLAVSVGEFLQTLS